MTVTYTSTTTSSSLTLTAAKPLVLYRSATTLSGVLSSDPTPLVPDDGNSVPLDGQKVTIKKHVAGTTGYTLVDSRTTGTDGAFSLPVTPSANTTYRAEWAGDTIDTVTYPPASAAVTVQVKPKVTVGVAKYNSRSGKYYRYKFGRVVYAKGSVAPNHAKLGDGTTGKVQVNVYKYKSTTRTWAKVKSVLRTLTTSSTCTWGWKPSARGTYRLQTAFRGDVDHVASLSVYRYVKVY